MKNSNSDVARAGEKDADERWKRFEWRNRYRISEMKFSLKKQATSPSESCNFFFNNTKHFGNIAIERILRNTALGSIKSEHSELRAVRDERRFARKDSSGSVATCASKRAGDGIEWKFEWKLPANLVYRRWVVSENYEIISRFEMIIAPTIFSWRKFEHRASLENRFTTIMRTRKSGINGVRWLAPLRLFAII